MRRATWFGVAFAGAISLSLGCKSSSSTGPAAVTLDTSSHTQNGLSFTGVSVTANISWKFDSSTTQGAFQAVAGRATITFINPTDTAYSVTVTSVQFRDASNAYINEWTYGGLPLLTGTIPARSQAVLPGTFTIFETSLVLANAVTQVAVVANFTKS
jgi:hypothetical protein